MLATGKLKPLGHYFIGQIVDYVGAQKTTLRRCELSRRRWYVVQTEPQQETRVEDAIEDINLATYLPRVPTKVHISRERYRTSMRPMLVGYLLAGFDAMNEPWQQIIDMRGVIKVFMIDGRPVPLAELELQRIRDAEALERMGKERKAPLVAAKVKDFVQVKDGPFAGFFGFVVEVDHKHGKIKVEVDIFGRPTPVELDGGQVDVVLDRPAGIGAIVKRSVYKRPRSPR